MEELTAAFIETIQLLEDSRRACAVRKELEQKIAQPAPKESDELERQVCDALMNHIRAMRSYDNAIVELAAIVCEKMWFPAYEYEIDCSADRFCSQSARSTIAAWLHTQLAAAWPNRTGISQRRLLRRVIDTLRRNLRNLTRADVEEILGEHSRALRSESGPR